jgi:hypothetical protein
LSVIAAISQDAEARTQLDVSCSKARSLVN